MTDRLCTSRKQTGSNPDLASYRAASCFMLIPEERIDMENIISQYTREQTIEDGVLIDVSRMAKAFK